MKAMSFDWAIVDLNDEEGNAKCPDVTVYDHWVVVGQTVIPRERVNWIQNLPESEKPPESGFIEANHD